MRIEVRVKTGQLSALSLSQHASNSFEVNMWAWQQQDCKTLNLQVKEHPFVTDRPPINSKVKCFEL